MVTNPRNVLSCIRKFSLARKMSSNTTGKDHGHRKFYDLTKLYENSWEALADSREISLPAEDTNLETFNRSKSPDISSNGFEDSNINEKLTLLKYINEHVIGRDLSFVSPFGKRKVVYCDYTASGKSLSFIEQYILGEVLPSYGNTHTTTTVTSLQTTLFRHEARELFRNAVNASESDAVIFTGTGCTGAVHKLINGLNFTKPPVVFVGPYEHHSNLLPWRELAAEVVRIPEDSSGSIDLEYLQVELKKHSAQNREMIGCFAAASNITGTLAPDLEITALLHQYRALAFWDYATAAPYVKLNMNPTTPDFPGTVAHKDAMYFSVHKFVGGVQSPGVLVVKKNLLRNKVPNGAGGGTVFFVSREGHRYLQEAEMREEGGTPAIVESIRAGLALQLKENVTAEVIMKTEEELVKKAINRWSNIPEFILLGNPSFPRLALFSFMIHHPSGYFLHHNFISAVLNDLYGIQARGGCVCAGPYAQDLLGIDEKLAQRYENILLEDSRLDRTHLRRKAEHSSYEILRPGLCRLNLAYFLNNEEVDFVLEAVAAVAKKAWLLLPQYQMNAETGEWNHINQRTFKERKWLGHIDYSLGRMRVREPRLKESAANPPDFKECLKAAEEIFALAASKKSIMHSLPDQLQGFSPEAAELRWFLLPSEAQEILRGNSVHASRTPFEPRRYPRFDEKISLNTSMIPDSSRSKMTRSRSWTQKEKNSEFVELDDKFVKTFKILDLTNGDSTNDKSTNKETAEPAAANGEEAEPSLTNQEPAKTELTNGYQEKYETANWNPAEILPANGEQDSSQTTNEDEESVAVANEIVRPQSPGKLRLAQLPWKPPPTPIMKPTLEALRNFKMIRSGDRVLVCVSGGKDSLSLLHTIRQYQKQGVRQGITFELGAMTVDPGSNSYDPSPLIPYMKQLGIPYFYEEQCIIDMAKVVKDVDSICSFCSRMKRGRIYACARREKYNVIAMGQHLDDLAESFFMSVLHNGRLRTMKASYTNQEGDIRIIRPFVFVREKELRDFAAAANLPVIAENCPACFEAPKERHRVKQLLAQQELLFPVVFKNIKTALLPLMSIDKPFVESQLFGKESYLKLKKGAKEES